MENLVPLPTSDGSPLIPHILLPAVQLLALALPPFRLRSFIFVLVISGLAVATYKNLYPGHNATRIAMVNHWPVFMATIEKLLFTDVEKDHWRLSRKPTEAVFMPLGMEKLKWAFSLMVALRGIGWNFQVKGVPPAEGPAPTKWRFLRRWILSYLKYCIVVDLLHAYMSRTVFASGVETIRASTWSQSFLNALFTGLKMYFPIQMTYTLGSILAVSLDISQPKDWHPLFGHIHEVTTMRHFWGTFWHQMMRKMLLGYSKALARLLRAPTGSDLSSYIQLYTSFAISGFFHALMTYNLPGMANRPLEESFWLAFNFFMLQALGIHLEDIALGSLDRLEKIFKHSLQLESTRKPPTESSWWRRIIGYVWTMSWLWFTLGWGGDAYLKCGILIGNDSPFPCADRLFAWLIEEW